MRILPLLAFAAMLANCAATGSDPHGDIFDRTLTAQAEPGKVVAAEMAFARAAQERGQWTAFADYATADAVMFVPEVVNAQSWLKGRANPAQAVAWQPHEVWSSCDGSLAIARGAAQWPDGSHGEYLTVWQRQANGDYRWTADLGHKVETPLTAPEMVATHVATCAKPIPAGQRQVQAEGEAAKGQSRDGSLQYAIFADDNGTSVTMMLWDGTWEVIGPLKFAKS